MKKLCISVLGCIALVAGSAYSQTAVSAGGAAPNSAQTTPLGSNAVAPEHQAPAAEPTPAPNLPSAQNQPAKEATLGGVEVKDPKDNPQEVALGKFVILKLDMPWGAIKQTPTNKLGLFINDLFMKGLEPLPVPEHPTWVMFQLNRNDDNRDAWGVLFGRRSFGKSETQKEQIALTIGLQDGSWAAKNPQVLKLEYFPDWWSWLVLPIPFLLAGITFFLGVKTNMLRDAGDPRADGKKGTYSLSRCQMALWFLTIVFAFLFTYAVTGDTPPIPQGILILMGIGAGTALGAAAIDFNKRTTAKRDFDNRTGDKTALPEQIPAAQVSASEGPILDLLSDENGISFHRLQVFGWTLVYWVIFVSILFKKVTMVDFDATQLALMGISSSTYLGFKLQEKQS